MDDLTRMLEDTAKRLLHEHCTKAARSDAEAGTWPAALWGALEESGLSFAFAPEEAGGAGLPLADVLGLVHIAARHAAPVPLAETLCAGWLAAACGLPVEEGPMSLAPVRPDERPLLARAGAGWRLSGRVTRVPWGGDAVRLAVLAAAEDGASHLALVPTQLAKSISRHHNLALEPRDSLLLDLELPTAAVARAPFGPDTLRALGAAMRTAQIAGALERALDLCVTYAQQRVQFGRPIAKFQAIQHALAALAGEAAAASAAVGLAAQSFERGPDMLLIAAAKGRASEAASAGAAIAHQVHGAIGFTWEYPLNLATRRLWSWRDEFGNEAEWYPVVTQGALAEGAASVWPAITRSNTPRVAEAA
jgi:acyl-CoA dehydrogenase